MRQWIDELLDKTTLTPDHIGEYTGDTKEIRPVTVSTYQILTYHTRRRGRDGDPDDLGWDDAAREAAGHDDFPHFRLFNERDWGLIIYDEVHLLPAPVFRITAELQGRRRLGLTATLVREDGREEDVFSLIGPKKYDVPWKDLERQGWIATADCHEVRLPLPTSSAWSTPLAESDKYPHRRRQPRKLDVVDELIAKHADDQVLIIGMYLEQLDEAAAAPDAPLLTGKTPVREREKLYQQFRDGELRLLIVSKVANFAIDLPDASVPSRSAAPSARARKRRSGWAASCARKATASWRTSTPWSRATPTIRTSAPIASSSSPSRATSTRFCTRMI